MTAAEQALALAEGAPSDAHARLAACGISIGGGYMPDGRHPNAPGDNTTEPAASMDPFQAEITGALAEIKAALGTDKAAKRAPLFSVDAACLLGEDFTAPQWLVTGLITRGGIGIIGGLPKAAKKTWLGTEIAVAVATGSKVCGEFYAERGTVAYFYAEDMRRQIRNRVRALLAGAGREMPVGRLHTEPRGSFLDVMRDEDLAWIVASARRLGPLDLLVLDPLRDVHSGEEDKSDSMRDVMRRLRLLGELLGCTVLAVHHAGKPSEATGKRGGGQRLRGSGAIHGSIDSGIYFLDCTGDGVSEFKNTVESEIKGARSAGTFTLGLALEDDDSGEAIRAVWTYARATSERAPVVMSSELVGEIAETMLAADGHRRTMRELRKQPGGGKADLAGAIRAMEAEGLVETLRRGRKHNGFRLTPAGVRFASGEAPDASEDPRVPG